MHTPFLHRTTLILIAAGALLSGAAVLFASKSQAADEATGARAKAALTVSLVQPAQDMLPIRLAANGNVAAWQEASIGTETAGLRLAEVRVNVGDAVRAGQVLATLAGESVQIDVAQARAALAEAQANAQEAGANAERARSLQNSGALSAQQISQYLTAEQTARARVEVARAQLDAQSLRLRHTQVLAPDSGIISARSATVGAVPGAGAELFRLIRQGRLEWRGEVTSAELGRLKAGMTVTVMAPGGAQGRGRVRMVSPTVDPATRNALVYVDLAGMGALRSAGPSQASNAPLGATFKAGMFARGEFELGSSPALTVPQTAVVVRDGFSYVYRVGADKRVSQLKVQTGRVQGERVEITAGLKAEDRVVASGGSFLSDGDLVRVVEANSKPDAAAAPVKSASAATK